MTGHKGENFMSNSLNTIQFDSQGLETAVLSRLAGSLEGKSVLEIGCGDGRLTWRYAPGAARVAAIDPNGEKIAKAIQQMPDELRDRVQFQVASLEEYLRANPVERFDLAILSWAL